MTIVNSPKIKILIIGPLPPPPGGIATNVQNLLQSDLRKYFRLICMKNSTARATDKKGRLDLLNIIYFLQNVLKLFGIMFYVRPSIVQIETSSGISFLKNSIFVIIAKIFRRKIILNIYGGGVEKFYKNLSLIGKRYVKFIFLCCRSIKVEYEQRKNFLANEIGVPERRIFVLTNAVYLNQITSKNAKTAKEEFKLLFVGWIWRHKGIFDLINSIEILKQKGYKIKIDVVGPQVNKEESANVLNAIRSKDLTEEVKIIGEKTSNEVQAFYSNADIFILPSYVEGFPYVILEAMSWGLPIVSSKIGAIPDVITDWINGFLIEPGDSLALIEKIEVLINNAKLRNEIGMNNYKKIESEYSMDTVVKKLTELYNILLSD